MEWKCSVILWQDTEGALEYICCLTVVLISFTGASIYLNLNLCPKMSLISTPDSSGCESSLLSLICCPLTWAESVPRCLFCDVAAILLMGSTPGPIFGHKDTCGACPTVLFWHLFKNVTFLVRNHPPSNFHDYKVEVSHSAQTASRMWTKGHYSTPKVTCTSSLRLLTL